MPLINRTYDFTPEHNSLLDIQSYTTHSYLNSAEIDTGGTLMLKNASDKRNTDNFYGDGRLGNKVSRYDPAAPDEVVTMNSLYFTRYETHATYGPTLVDVWWERAAFQVGDEIVLYAKHIRTEDDIDELGKWEICTITGRIEDSEGVHYQIDKVLHHEWDERTANAGCMVYQYESLTIEEGSHFQAEEAYSSSVMYCTVEGWNSIKISYPGSVFMIKVRTEINIHKDASIGSRFGYNGAAQYYDRYYTDEFYEYNDAGAPLGAGSNKTWGLVASMRDKRSAGCMRLDLGDSRTNAHDINYGHSGGGLDSYGVANDDYYGKPMPISTDLNEKMYCGVGGATFRYGYDTNGYSSDYYQSNHAKGQAGGGILIVQTPKIVFHSNNSYLSTIGSFLGSRRRIGRTPGGSILVKASVLEFHENPDLTSHFADTNIIDKKNFITEAGPDAVYTNHVAPPGQIQLEFDKWVNVYDSTEYNSTDITSTVLDNHIATRYHIEYKTLRSKYLDLIWNYNDKLAKYSLAHWSPKYETGEYFKVKTAGSNNIDVSMWFDIYGFELSWLTPEYTDIRIVLSIDGGSTWKAVDFGDGIVEPELIDITLSNTDLSTKGNTPEQLHEYVNRLFYITELLEAQMGSNKRTLDFCFALKTDLSSMSPSISFLNVVYDGTALVKPPIPVVPYNGMEFNNEYVDFVWLQPSQRSGTLQNRIEISASPNFERDQISFMNVDDNEVSSIGNDAVVAFQPTIFDSDPTPLAYFKLPYLKNRKRRVEYAIDSDYNSLYVDPNTETMSYEGGDIYFHKGSSVELADIGTITKPTQMDFKIGSVSNAPNNGHMLTYLNFCNKELVNGLNDDLGYYDSKLTGGMETKINKIHGTVPNLQSTHNNVGQFFMEDDKGTTCPVLGQDAYGTEYIRFSVKDMASGSSCYIVSHWAEGYAKWARIIALVAYTKYDGTLGMRFRYHDGAYWRFDSTVADRVPVYQENTMVLKYFGDNLFDVYLNGIRIAKNAGNVSYYDKSKYTGRVVTTFGGSYNGGSLMNGTVLEYATWDVLLSDTEVAEISKIPSYHLRYNMSTHDVEWRQVPYKDHLTDYEYARQNVDLDIHQADNRRTGINSFDFCNGNRSCYYSNNDSILFGTYYAADQGDDSFIRHKAWHKPINGIPFIRKGTTNTEVDWDGSSLTLYKDNNSIELGRTTVQYLIKHGRIHFDRDSLQLTFTYDETVSESIGGYIGMVTGYYTTANTTATSFAYSRYIIVQSNQVKIWVYHTNGTRYNIRNKTLPYNLKDKNIYTLSMVVGNSGGEIDVILESDSDENYLLPYKVYGYEETAYRCRSVGYNSEDYNDESAAADRLWQDAGILMYNTTNSPYKPISLSVYDSNSNLYQSGGYGDRTDIVRRLTSSQLSVLNDVTIHGELQTNSDDIRVFFRFDPEDAWKVYSSTTNKWIAKSTTTATNGMTVDDTIRLATTMFEAEGGVDYDKDMSMMIVLISGSASSTPYLTSAELNFNGPEVHDSWIEPGSYYNPGDVFYYNNSPGWNPYIDPSFIDASQGWTQMGTGVPGPTENSDEFGSPASSGASKVYAGFRLQVVPKGKWYWRVFAYNGVK